MTDPFAVLGLTPNASLDEVRMARRTLALVLHPDVGGDESRMQEVNVAFEAAVAHVTGRRMLPNPVTPGRVPRSGRRIYRPVRRRVQVDAPSFTIDAMPPDAFEALSVVATWLGEVAVEDPPRLLEVRLDDPAPCWCRLELVGEAGATTVSLTVVFDAVGTARVIDNAMSADHDQPAGERADNASGARPVDAETIRDAWVANLNRLGPVPDGR
ncbi:MAG: J domain-containing protein [Ilumatobacteraceae bacterium]